MDSMKDFEEARQLILKSLTAPTQFPTLLEAVGNMIERGEAPFKSLRDFVNAPVNKDGIGISGDDRLKLMLWYNPKYKHVSKRLSVQLGLAETAKHIEPLKKHGKRGKGKRVDGNEIVNSFDDQGGNSTTHRLAKIARDYPKLADRIKAGEFKSVIDAERAAGIKPPLREKKQVWFYKDDPKAAIKALSEYYGIEVNYEG